MNIPVKSTTDAWLMYIYKRLGALISAIDGGGTVGSGNYSFLTAFTVGITPGAPSDGSTAFINPSVTGDIQVHKNGTGYLDNTADDESQPGFVVTDSGGITLTGGLVFSNDETYTIFKVNP